MIAYTGSIMVNINGEYVEMALDTNSDMVLSENTTLDNKVEDIQRQINEFKSNSLKVTKINNYLDIYK